MSQKIQSQGSSLEVFSPFSPNEWVLVQGVSNIRDLRSGTAAEIDVTDLSSTAKEFVLGLADNGSMTADCFYDPNDPGQIAMESLRDSSARNSFRVKVNNPLGGSPPQTAFTFQGFVSTFPFTVGVDAAMTGTISIRLTGAITKGPA